MLALHLPICPGKHHASRCDRSRSSGAPHGDSDASCRGPIAGRPHHRLTGRPVVYQVIAGQTLEITYRDVPRIDESELIGVKHLISEQCFSSVTPQTAETLIVRFVVPLKS